MEFTGLSRVELLEGVLIGALLRVPANAVQRRIIAGLNRVGFADLRPPHIVAFLYPGPEGCRPGDIAARAGMSKQAMNQILQTLERLGYLYRDDGVDDGRARVVHLTPRGQAAWDAIINVLEEIEEEWRCTLGDDKFRQLRELLGEVWGSDLVS